MPSNNFLSEVFHKASELDEGTVDEGNLIVFHSRKESTSPPPLICTVTNEPVLFLRGGAEHIKLRSGLGGGPMVRTCGKRSDHAPSEIPVFLTPTYIIVRSKKQSDIHTIQVYQGRELLGGWGGWNFLFLRKHVTLTTKNFGTFTSSSAIYSKLQNGGRSRVLDGKYNKNTKHCVRTHKLLEKAPPNKNGEGSDQKMYGKKCEGNLFLEPVR